MTDKANQLDWKGVESLESGQVVASINRAVLEFGNAFYSVRIGRKNPDGKLTQFLRPDDLDNLADLAKETKLWIQADIGELRADKPKKTA